MIGNINDTLRGFQRYAIEMNAVKSRLMLARLPPFLRKLHTKLDRLFTKMATGSISSVYLSLSLHPHKSDTLHVGTHCTHRENRPTHTGYCELISDFHIDRHGNSESLEVDACLGCG